MSDIRRLYRSTTDKQISGVCGGIAEYAAVDATLVRVAWVLMTLVTGVVPGVFAYLIFMIIIPVEPAKTTKKEKK